MSQEVAIPELTIAQRAMIAIGYDEEKAQQELTDLAEQSKGLTAVTNGDSYKQIHAARMALKNRRIEIEKKAKAARDEAVKFSKSVIEIEKRLIGFIQPEEQRLEKIQNDHDEAEERNKREKIEAEMRRVQALQDRIADIRSPLDVGTRFNTSSATISVYVKDVEAISVDETFQEFRESAEAEKATTLAKLREAHAAAVAREEEQCKAAEAQAELAKLRAEQQERERQEREKREAEEKAMREKLAAEQAEIARQQKIENDRLAAERERIAEEERVAREAREAEERIAREKIAAENKRLADERAAFEAEQAEVKRKADEAEQARLAAKAAERKREEEARLFAKKSKFPGEKAIVDALMTHFGVSEQVITGWLAQLRKAA